MKIIIYCTGINLDIWKFVIVGGNGRQIAESREYRRRTDISDVVRRLNLGGWPVEVQL